MGYGLWVMWGFEGVGVQGSGVLRIQSVRGCMGVRWGGGGG